VAVTASPEIQARLLDVAACDLEIQRASTALRGLSDTLHIPTLEAALDEIKGRLHDALVEKETIQAELTRAESDVQLVESRIAQDEERLVHTASAKDAQGLEHELESLKKRRSDLEDIELAIMERLEQADSALSGLEAERDTAEGALAEARTQFEATSAELTAQRSTQEAARGDIVSSLPEDLYALYERQRERYGVGASHLRGGVSSASGVALTESDLQEIRTAAPDQVILCPDSNAILVRTSESGL
jgi:predicted  nucleic acid-binding Zn-ribbon protein